MFNEIHSYINQNRTYWRTLLTDGIPLSARRILTTNTRSRQDSAKTALIILADPNSALGSLGDAALLISALSQLLKKYKLSDIYLLGLREDEISIPGLGTVKIVAAFDSALGTSRFAHLCQNAAELYVIGADVLDGKYDPGYTCRLLTYADHAARMNISVTILGFSFNKKPNPSASRALKSLHHNVSINLRDDASLERFIKNIGRDATLTADIAFLLDPISPPPEITEWIESRKARGELVVGININRHALPDLGQGSGHTSLIKTIATELPMKAYCGSRINYILVPHDLKPSSGDIELLTALKECLQEKAPEQVLYVELKDPRAIKGLASKLDALVTGRMHLAIAALGVYTPVLCIDYQDKFEGLLRKFGLNITDSLSTKDELTETINQRIMKMVEKRVETRKAIQASFPTVKALSSLNFKNILPVVLP